LKLPIGYRCLIIFTILQTLIPQKTNITEAKLILNFYAFGTYAEPGLMNLFEVQNVDDNIDAFKTDF